jgi:hypothetical protein
MQESEEILNSPGDFKVEELTLTSSTGDVFDISNFMLELHIYEDVFSPCMTGKLIFADAINLISSVPILGNEIITVKIRTPTLEDNAFNVIEKSFQIYSIDDRTLTSDRSQYYTISFISKEGYYDSVIPISKTFRGKTNEIVSDIYDTYIKAPRRFDNEEVFTNLIITDAPHQSNLSYTSNFWPPFKNLNFISRRCRGASLSGADHLFFETNKSFYFSSLEALINDQLASGIFEEYVIELDGMTLPRRSNDLKYYGNIFQNSMTKIETLKMTKTLNALEGQTSGYFSNTVLGYDLTTKKMSEINFNFIDNNNAFVKTDVGTPIPADVAQSSYANSEFVMFNTCVFNDYGKTATAGLPEGHPAQLYADRHTFRKSYLNSFDHFRFEMTIPGRTDIEVGNLINMLHPNPSVIDESDIDTIIDPILSGVYLITAIHHKFDDNRHVITAEIVKNGLKVNLGEKVNDTAEL